jgi:hypothetical protein
MKKKSSKQARPAPSTPTRRMTASETARLAGISRQRVSQLLMQGRTPQEIIESVHQRKHSERAAAKEQQTFAASRGNRKGEPLEPFSSSQRRRSTAIADRAELEMRVRQGELLPVSQVNVWLGGCIIKAREIWLGIPSLVPQIRQCDDPIAAQRLVDDEIRRGLLELEKFGAMLAGRVAEGGNGGDDE